MAIENINDLDTAEIRFNNDGKIDDLYVAIFKDNTMNFVDINNFPIYTKYKIDEKIRNFEREMTLKMQERNIVNKIYTRDEETGEIVESYLNLNQIADKMNSFACKEIGVRYNISSNSDIEYTSFTHMHGVNVIRQGTNVMLSNVDYEASQLSPVFNIINENGIEIKQEDIYVRDYYPWNKMKKMQISLDGLNYNYDLSFDNGGNYFTEVPLYYIDQRYILEEEYTVTAYDGSTQTRYRKILDITDNGAPVSVYDIPEEYRNDNYSIGMYKWVCEYPLPGYRPASFFIKKVNKIPEIDDGSYPNAKRYVKVEINNVTYYILYKNYLEGNLKNNEVPALYCLEKEDNTGYNTNILTSKHYFSCYEMSYLEMGYNGRDCAISRPGQTPITRTLGTMIHLANILGEDYFIQDMRSRSDFYYHLMDIEFATLDSSSICTGYYNENIANSGETDVSDSRNAIIKNKGNVFKWNWIENPYGNIYKYIDGICLVKDYTSYNRIRYSDIPKLYSDPRLYPYSTQIVDYTNQYQSPDLLFNPAIPWLQIPFSIDFNPYPDMFQNDADMNYAPIAMGGSYKLPDKTLMGLRCFYGVSYRADIDDTYGYDLGALFQKYGD